VLRLSAMRKREKTDNMFFVMVHGKI